MIILCRHGNTFNTDDEVKWIGSETDLELTDAGVNQAGKLAIYLENARVFPKIIYSASLQRTLSYASILSSRLGSKLIVDKRLNEINYGAWEGLSRNEIINKFGYLSIDDWENRLIWPKLGSCWGDDPFLLQDRILRFLNEMVANDLPGLVCTSNGIMRIIRFLIDGSTDTKSTKVNTGNFCILNVSGGELKISCWNHSPL